MQGAYTLSTPSILGLLRPRKLRPRRLILQDPLLIQQGMLQPANVAMGQEEEIKEIRGHDGEPQNTYIMAWCF